MGKHEELACCLARLSLIESAQKLAARCPETGIKPENFFLFSTSEIAGTLAYLKRFYAEKMG